MTKAQRRKFEEMYARFLEYQAATPQPPEYDAPTEQQTQRDEAATREDHTEPDPDLQAD